MWSARFLSHMNHVSVSPTDGNGPTQGQRKTLTRMGIEPTTFWLDLRRQTDWATRSDGSRPWELKMLKSRQWTCTSTNVYKRKVYHLQLWVFKVLKRPWKDGKLVAWRRATGQLNNQTIRPVFTLLASSPFLDSREGARNSRAKAENWSEWTEGAWGEASPQSLLLSFPRSSLASLCALGYFARSRDYLERNC